MDFKLTFGIEGGDLALAHEDLALDETLETAIIISLFTDRRADPDDELDNADDRRGWWGDMFADDVGDEIGSRLWLLDRQKQTTENLNRAEEYTKEALQWMIDDGVARDIEVTASYPNDKSLGLEVEITKPDGTVETFRFSRAWDALGGEK